MSQKCHVYPTIWKKKKGGLGGLPPNEIHTETTLDAVYWPSWNGGTRKLCDPTDDSLQFGLLGHPNIWLLGPLGIIIITHMTNFLLILPWERVLSEPNFRTACR